MHVTPPITLYKRPHFVRASDSDSMRSSTSPRWRGATPKTSVSASVNQSRHIQPYVLLPYSSTPRKGLFRECDGLSVWRVSYRADGFCGGFASGRLPAYHAWIGAVSVDSVFSLGHSPVRDRLCPAGCVASLCIAVVYGWVSSGGGGVVVFATEGRRAGRQSRGARYSPGATVRARRATPLKP